MCILLLYTTIHSTVPKLLVVERDKTNQNSINLFILIAVGYNDPKNTSLLACSIVKEVYEEKIHKKSECTIDEMNSLHRHVEETQNAKRTPRAVQR